MSRFDSIWRRLIVTQLFTKGWGNPDHLTKIFQLRKQLGQREIARQLVAKDTPVYIDKEHKENGYRILEGHFQSPFNDVVPDVMPKEAQIARFQMILPTEWKTELRPICLQFGGTGDHGFGGRRNLMARPLLQEHGIASLILETPYYGCRKPKNQFRSSIHYVSDLFVMGSGIILESIVLLNWLEKLGYGPMGASGMSMGGHFACLAGTSWHKPLSLVPCMSWTTASPVFTKGVLSKTIPWKILLEQYNTDKTYENDLMKHVESPEGYWNSDIYKAGRYFVNHMDELPNNDSSINNCDNLADKDNHVGHSPIHIEHSTARTIDHLRQAIHFAEMEKSGDQSSLNLQSKSGNQSTETGRDVINKADCDTNSPVSWSDSLYSNISWLQSMYQSAESEADIELRLKCQYFMKGIMDECTHLGNYSTPVDPELITILVAEHDGYYLRNGVLELNNIWKGSKVKYFPRGHVAGFFFERKMFRQAVADSFYLQMKKYYPDQSPDFLGQKEENKTVESQLYK